MPAARLTTRLPSLLQQLLHGREVLDEVDLAVGDDDVGPPLDDRPDEVGDPLLRVLVVAVGVDDDVGAELEGVVDAVLEGAGQPLVAGVPHEVRDAERAGDLDRPVGRAVVDDDDDDLVDALDRRSGSTAAPTGRVSSSLRHGTCTTSFMAIPSTTIGRQAPVGVPPADSMSSDGSVGRLSGSSRHPLASRRMPGMAQQSPAPEPVPGCPCSPIHGSCPWCCSSSCSRFSASTARHGDGSWDYYTANYASWHLVHEGDPWLDGGHGARSRGQPRGVDLDHGGRQRSHGRQRFPGVIAISLPAYWVAQSDTMTVVPGAMTAALASALGS